MRFEIHKALKGKHYWITALRRASNVPAWGVKVENLEALSQLARAAHKAVVRHYMQRRRKKGAR